MSFLLGSGNVLNVRAIKRETSHSLTLDFQQFPSQVSSHSPTEPNQGSNAS